MTTGSIEPQRRPFGVGKPVSLFTLGTMRALHSPGQLEAVVEAAIAAGINHLETAPAYGPAQRYLGQAIRRLRLSREQLVITSKVLPNQSLASAQDDVRRSLEQLELDRLDNLAVHGINRPEHLDWALQGPIEVLRSVDAMHRQVVEPIELQLLEAAPHVVLGAGQALVWQHFAGDHQLLAAEPQAPNRLS